MLGNDRFLLPSDQHGVELRLTASVGIQGVESPGKTSVHTYTGVKEERRLLE